eukprot:TRINITY_DN38693_c0_g1_i1.p1 TRINITY_DN38693_c0_g1~~TRINITY_DN38693_c0_g1_i1.p1  ORF type:complete len:507 (+),score=61.86 TRINITY_DN38693_c0_g1_i1:167-1687(+)
MTSHDVSALWQRWQAAFEDVDGYKLSACDTKNGMTDPYGGRSLAYGEVLFPDFVRLLKKAVSLGSLPCDGSASFVDLGCGVGKAVVAAAVCPKALLCPVSSAEQHDPTSASFFARCTGIELLPSLATSAKQAAEKFACMGGPEEKRSKAGLEIRCDDILQVDWHGYDVVFCTTLLFSPPLILDILDRCRALREGSVAIVLTDPSRLFASIGVLYEWFAVHTLPAGLIGTTYGHPAVYVLVRTASRVPRSWASELSHCASMGERCDRWYQAVEGMCDGEPSPGDGRWLGAWVQDSSHRAAEPDLFQTRDEQRFECFVKLLRGVLELGHVPSDGTAQFLEIGCGAGKALLAAALFLAEWLPISEDVHPAARASGAFFRSCRGVELAAPLAARARHSASRLSSLMSGKREAETDSVSCVEVLNEACLDVDWCDCNVVYVDATQMSDALFQAILEKASCELVEGSLLLALLDPTSLVLSEESPVADAFTCQRLQGRLADSSAVIVLYIRT